MKNVLLISEDYIKTYSGLNENVWGSYLFPAIKEAQEINLQQILGEKFYSRLLIYVNNGRINDKDYAPYKALLDDYIQPYLLYQTIANIVPIIGVKLTNLGVVVSNDEHIVNLSQNERQSIQDYYSNRADFYGKRLQEFLKKWAEDYKELELPSDFGPTLNTIASTQLFLGGLRGRKLN